MPANSTDCPPPQWLAESGRKLWADTLQVYELNAPQLDLLAECSKLADRLAECRTALQAETLVGKDRFGMPKMNPHAVHELQCAGQLSRMLERLLKHAPRRATGEPNEFFGSDLCD